MFIGLAVGGSGSLVGLLTALCVVAPHEARMGSSAVEAGVLERAWLSGAGLLLVMVGKAIPIWRRLALGVSGIMVEKGPALVLVGMRHVGIGLMVPVSGFGLQVGVTGCPRLPCPCSVGPVVEVIVCPVSSVLHQVFH